MGYVYQGQERTLKEIAGLVGMSTTTIQTRMAKGMSFEEAISTPLKRPATTYGCKATSADECFSCEFPDCVRKASRILTGERKGEKYECTDHGVEKRIGEKPVKKKRRGAKRYLYMGEKRSIAEIAEITGIWQNTIRYRLSKGMTIEEAVSRKPNYTRSHGVCTAKSGDDCFNCTFSDCVRPTDRLLKDEKQGEKYGRPVHASHRRDADTL